VVAVIPIVLNRDRNISVANYRELAGNGQLLVTSIFATIQGEGPLAGGGCVFLRLAGCNIGAKEDCPWCDTYFDFDGGRVMRVEVVLAEIREKLNGSVLVVVTGGEPLLQWEVMSAMMADATDLAWQFETNGLLLKDGVTRDILTHPNKAIRVVVSPKVPATLGKYRAIPAHWHELAEVLCLKYVVEDNPHSNYHQPGPVRAHEHLPALDTYVSGMAVYRRQLRPGEVANIWDDTLIDPVRTRSNYNHAARIVMDHPGLYWLSLQTHLFAGVE
jgi:organic radical activating enzyme